MKRNKRISKILEWLELLEDEEVKTVYLFVSTMIKLKNILDKRNKNVR